MSLEFKMSKPILTRKYYIISSFQEGHYYLDYVNLTDGLLTSEEKLTFEEMKKRIDELEVD